MKTCILLVTLIFATSTIALAKNSEKKRAPSSDEEKATQYRVRIKKVNIGLQAATWEAEGNQVLENSELSPEKSIHQFDKCGIADLKFIDQALLGAYYHNKPVDVYLRIFRTTTNGRKLECIVAFSSDLTY